MHEPVATLAYNPSFCLSEDALEHHWPDATPEPVASLAYDPAFHFVQSPGDSLDFSHIES